MMKTISPHSPAGILGTEDKFHDIIMPSSLRETQSDLI